MVPNAVLHYYTLLDLTPTEFLVFVAIESYHWDANKFPFPSVETLAKKTGLSPRTVTRTITSLEKDKKVIKRIKRKYKSNEYCFDPMVFRLLEIIEHDTDGSLSGRNGSQAPDIDDFIYPTDMSAKEYKHKQDKIKQTNEITPQDSLRGVFGG